MPGGEICILAGGLSARMGRDKARMRLGGKTLLARVKDTANETPWPVRVIRRDAVARCGPLGGVITALRAASADWVLFLACDMPFINAALLKKMIDAMSARGGAIFAQSGRAGPAGFPFILRREHLAIAEAQRKLGHFSIQKLATACRAKKFTVPSSARVLFNLNTPGDWQIAGQGFTKFGPERA